MHLWLLSLLLFFSFKSQGQIIKIDVHRAISSGDIADPYEFFPSKIKKSSNALVNLKKTILRQNWEACLEQAPRVFDAQRNLRGWIALNWLDCLEESNKKKANVQRLGKALDHVFQEQSIFLHGPWAPDLRKKWVQLRMEQLENISKSKPLEIRKLIAGLFDDRFELTSDQKAKLFQLLGEASSFIKDEEQANYFLNFNSPSLREKPDEGGEEKIEKGSNKIEQISNIITFLNQNPGSRFAKKIKDRPLELYNSLTVSEEKQRALALLKAADGGRVFEWSQFLHRRLDYEGSLELSKNFLERHSTSNSSTQALWVAGRSAQFLGKYDLAIEYFDKLIKGHQGTEEFAEALFRSGLAYYRLKKFSNAAERFEDLVRLERDKFDLQARYWLTRALEKFDPKKAHAVSDELQSKYPFSYYGLKLRAERQNGLLTWPEGNIKNLKLRSSIYLVGNQNAAWVRFKSLASAGWVVESNKEFASLQITKDPQLKMSLAEKLTRVHLYQAAIKLINEALEKDVQLRQEQFVNLGYPLVFESLYSKESQKYGIDVAILRSLTRQESAFNVEALSTSNAMGLMQMIPPTAMEIAKGLGLKVVLPDDMYLPSVNIPMGSYYVAQMLDQFQGHLPLALGAYNAGPTRLKTWLDCRVETREIAAKLNINAESDIWFDELPWSETSFYIKAILRNILLYKLSEFKKIELKASYWGDLLNKKSE